MPGRDADLRDDFHGCYARKDNPPVSAFIQQLPAAMGRSEDKIPSELGGWGSERGEFCWNDHIPVVRCHEPGAGG